MDNSLTIPAAGKTSFWKCIWENRTNRKYLLWGFGLSVVEFIMFKILYPYPDFFSDSYSYIYAAYAQLDISIWPIGYSKFLAAFHHLTYSDTALVGFQFFFMQAAALYFYFTILYFFTTSKATRIILFIFLFVNPLTLYLCNTINSDALFGALSLFWITELIWIIQCPRIYQLFMQAILISICFTVRNNAYYYPLISAIVILLSKQHIIRKSFGIALPILLIALFITSTMQKAYELTGTKQFSLFTGWQLANNALYIYDQITVDSNSLPTEDAKELNRISIAYFNSVDPNGYREYLESYVGNYFIREPDAPLKIFAKLHYNTTGEFNSISAWGKASAVFELFGKSILLNHPFAYIRYFMLPNTWHYFLPPLSHLERYNYGGAKISPIARIWFNYPSNKIHCVSFTAQKFLFSYSVLFLLINLLFIFQLFNLLVKRKYMQLESNSIRLIVYVFCFALINFLFSIFTTVNILRYQFIPMLLIFSFTIIIDEQITSNDKKDTTKLNHFKKRRILDTLNS